MGKKYELIKANNYWYRVKALQDFTLITGDTIKQGDIGGFVKSEGCLSHEGLCWIKDEAYVKGRVAENAVIKDHGYVDANAIVTENAVVQAYQQISYGTVTTDLLGTKDWEGALYAEFGLVPEDGKVILYKRVWSTNFPDIFTSDCNNKFLYVIGKEVFEFNINEDVMKAFGKGLHFTSLEFVGNWKIDIISNIIIECEINVEDILTVMNGVVRARKCKVIRAYEEE